MKGVLTIVFLFMTILNQTNQKFNTNIPDISEKKLAELINDLRTGEHVDLHKFLLKLVLHPEDVDLNKDRKISPKELRKSMEWVIMPKKNEILQMLHPDIIEKTKAGIELFITNIKGFLRYKQYQELLSRIRIEHFLDIDRAKKNIQAKIAGMELYDDL